MTRAIKSGILRQLDSRVSTMRYHVVLLKRSFIRKQYTQINFQSFSANYLINFSTFHP